LIETLQIKILEKIGSYGQSIESVKKEMNMMQDSFAKMVPDIAKKSLWSSTVGKVNKTSKKKI